MPPQVSIIVTCYNLGRYIGEALASVRDQTFDGTKEVIVVDDASTDDSAAVIASFPDVRLIRLSQNGGVMRAMLRGIEESRGGLIFFLDGDDVWEPGKLAEAVQLFGNDPSLVMVTHDLTYIQADGSTVAQSSKVARRMDAIPQESWSDAIRKGVLEHDDYVWLGSAFAVRRSKARLGEFMQCMRSLPDVGNVYQDWPLAYWCAALPGESNFGYLPAKLFRYRLHQSNHSGDARTAERAERNYRRAALTMGAMVAIAERHQVLPATRRKILNRQRHYSWLASLYREFSTNQLRQFVQLVPYMFAERSLIKDVARMTGSLILGPQRLAALVSRIGNA